MKPTLFFLLPILVLASPGSGQSVASPRSAEKPSRPRVPVVTVAFSDDKSVPILADTSPAMEFPIQYGSGGRYFVNLIMPPDFSTTQLYSISKSKGIVKYSAAAVDEMHDIEVKSYSPTSSGVILLVNATRSQRQSKHSVPSKDGGTVERTRYSGDHLDYLLAFDEDGAFKSVVEVDQDLTISRAARFDNGTYLAFGVRTSDRSLHLALLDQQGALMRLLDLPRSVTNLAEKEWKEQPGASQVGLTPWVQFVDYHGNILVVPQHSIGNIFEVRSSGEIRTLHLNIPSGLSIDALIPSSRGTYARVSPSDQGGDSSKSHLYEFNPESGSLVRELKAEGASLTEIANEQDGEFVAFHVSDGGKLVAMQGKLE